MLINLGQKISSDKWGQVAASFPLSNGAAEQTHSCRSSGWVEGGASQMRLAALPLCFTPGAACHRLNEEMCYFCTKHPVFPLPLPLGCCFDLFFGFLFLLREPEKIFTSCSSARGLLEVPHHAFALQHIVPHGLAGPNFFLGESFPQASC